MTSIWAIVSPALARTLRVAGTGPIPMTRGATPATAAATMRARGVSPCCRAAASEATRRAQAPSLTPEALPAVTVPFGRVIGRSLASASMEVSRGCSSRSTATLSPRLAGTMTGVISAAKVPSRCARAARSWLRKANWSWSAREMPYSSATFSAVSAIASMPYFSTMSLLTKRQPIVVSWISMLREKAVSAFGMTKGARLMLSTPPAMMNSASPPRIAQEAIATAFMPEPHSRLIVLPGTASGRPASSSAMRATLRLSSPA
jgi:hypothetical protein